MYNKIFTKILDSSVWLEDDTTRIVWFTFLAAMDETGFAVFASIQNLAHRARVDLEKCKKSVEKLEGPDKDSSDQDNEGRRIERVPGGWIVLNSEKYREMVSREVAREKTRLRVAKFRHEKRCNGGVTLVKRSVTPSEADTDTETDTDAEAEQNISTVNASSMRQALPTAEDIYQAYPLKVGKPAAIKAITRALVDHTPEFLLARTQQFSAARHGDKEFCPHPSTWFNQARFNDDAETWKPRNESRTHQIGNGYHRPTVADQRNREILGSDEIRQRIAAEQADPSLSDGPPE